MSAPALSLCMIVKDEARCLPLCLNSVRDLEAEQIIVDTGSTDDTQSIAEAAGAKVFHFGFDFVDFAAARNFGLEKANAPWILVLDADETMDVSGVPLVLEIVATRANLGYYLERHNHASDKADSTIDYAVRLFPNCGYRYHGRVHETIDASFLAGGGQLKQSAIKVDHRFITDREHRRNKNHRYIEILKEEIAVDPDDNSRLDFLAAEYHQLEMYDEATAVAEQLARVRPLDARAHLFAGTYHLLYRPDFEQARRDFNRALELKPGYLEAESFLRLLERKQSEH